MFTPNVLLMLFISSTFTEVGTIPSGVLSNICMPLTKHFMGSAKLFCRTPWYGYFTREI